MGGGGRERERQNKTKKTNSPDSNCSTSQNRASYNRLSLGSIRGILLLMHINDMPQL
jgi:hypothetical protein